MREGLRSPLVWFVCALLGVAGVILLAPAAPGNAAPASNTVQRERVRAVINDLRVAAHSHGHRYDRARDFGDWITQDGECDTRATVLIEESLKPVTRNQYCTISKGKWFSMPVIAG